MKAKPYQASKDRDTFRQHSIRSEAEPVPDYCMGYKGKEAKLSNNGNRLVENRNGLALAVKINSGAPPVKGIRMS